MKPNQRERDKLAGDIRSARARSSLSISEIARLAKVSGGQTSRILNGEFKTVSWSVVQICTVLAIDPKISVTRPTRPSKKAIQATAAWAKLEATVRRAWDKTPQGAEKLVRVIEAVAEMGAKGAEKVP